MCLDVYHSSAHHQLGETRAQNTNQSAMYEVTVEGVSAHGKGWAG